MKKIIPCLCAALIFSCSSGENDAETPSSSSVVLNGSSSSIFQSSSSVQSSSSSVIEIFTDPRDNQTYRTVIIGSKRWMAENLNFAAKNSVCHRNDPANCERYGKLYDWDAAMNACPEGWRLPSNADWESLAQAAGGMNEAGKKLKTTTGWCYGETCGNGTDDFGFSAMPGSSVTGGALFSLIGLDGHWWSAEKSEIGWEYKWYITFESNRIMPSAQENFKWGYSVRCVEGESNGVGEEHFNSSITYSSFTDNRDNKTYRSVEIGNRTWMAENLNYATDNDSWCYRNGYCTEYGRLYTRDAAIDACPAGWRLPDDDDWNDLIETAGGGGVAGGKLKSKIGWHNSYATLVGTPGNGTDDFGFSAIPGGLIDGNIFSHVGSYGCWWSATEVTGSSMTPTGVVPYTLSIQLMLIGSNEMSPLQEDLSKGRKCSVRCVRD